MKYYLIVGEASGDLHASNLMRALIQEDPEAEFRFFGGDLMTAVGGTRVKHYKELAYMGFILEFFAGHQYPVHYVGNPCVDAVDAYCKEHPDGFPEFVADNGLSEKPVIALLAGSRKQEIKDNLPMMLEAAAPFTKDYQLVLAGAPGMDPAYYSDYINPNVPVKIIFGQTYRLLQHAQAALVTSGTATLETALFRVPQVVCYYTPVGKFIAFLRRHILKVKYISLVNLVADKEVVRELVADTMTVDNVRSELESLLYNKVYRNKVLEEYDRIIQILGPAGASGTAAREMVALLKK